jgi:hypothetical protein
VPAARDPSALPTGRIVRRGHRHDKPVVEEQVSNEGARLQMISD